MKIEQITLYISAAGDLKQERESLSRAISEIPVPMGWRILFSPIRGEPVDLEEVRRSDLHLLILGSDIRAPVGAEWITALRGGKRPALFLKADCLRTPAAEDFVRHLKEEASWINYKNPADLRMQALKWVANQILELSGYYSLSAKEYERLKDWRDGLDFSEEIKIDDRGGGTGESSIILTTERFIPKDGILIQPPKKKNGNNEKMTGSSFRENP
jgi:hypothetical protein